MHGIMRCAMMTSRRRRCCPLLGADTELFCASLVEGLVHLESTLEVDDGASGGGVSMRWCADAMRMVKRMQREMLDIFRNADVQGAGHCSWFEHYMQETAALLDFCNAFKAAVSRMHRYCMVVDFAAAQAGGARAAAADVSLVEGVVAAAPRCDAELMSVKAAVADAERLGRTATTASGGMVVVTLVAKITMAVVSVLVLQALTSRSPSDTPASHPPALIIPEELEPWRKSLSLIHGRFPSRATVAEHEKVSMAVQDLISGQLDGGGDGGHGDQRRQEEAARTHVELLRARSGELREGVEMFDSVLDDVFDEVIRGRNEMLGILRDKALT
jgi:hypothetical protein